MVDGLCQRWGQTPDTIRALNAHEVFQMLELVAMVPQKKAGK